MNAQEFESERRQGKFKHWKPSKKLLRQVDEIVKKLEKDQREKRKES